MLARLLVISLSSASAFSVGTAPRPRAAALTRSAVDVTMLDFLKNCARLPRTRSAQNVLRFARVPRRSHASAAAY